MEEIVSGNLNQKSNNKNPTKQNQEKVEKLERYEIKTTTTDETTNYVYAVLLQADKKYLSPQGKYSEIKMKTFQYYPV